MSVLPVLLVALCPLAAAGGPVSAQATALHRVLSDDQGWELVRETDGVTISRKSVGTTEMVAWKGEKVFPPGTDGEKVFALLRDTARHTEISPGLIASTIVQQEGDGALYFQVIDAPVPISDRYWIARSRTERDVGGRPGHLRRSWSTVGPTHATDLRATLQARYPAAVEVPETHGRWDLIPLENGGLRVVYRSLVDPGGAVPQGLANRMAGRSVADNINRMVAQSQQP